MTRIEYKVPALLLAGVMLAAVSPLAPAAAADLGGYKPARMPPPIAQPINVPSSWAGWYLGGHVGGVIDGDGDVTGGAHLGHNWQNGNFVFGAEGDLGFAEKPDTFGSVRARAGIANRSWLFYGTAGVAFDDNDAGLAAGGGIEYKVSDATSIGVEALNYDLDDNFTVLQGRLTWHFGGARY